MGLSYDLISEFVKVTNNKVEPKNETVYGTVVQGSDGKYVKIDGSDILTPMDTTTDIEDGERVIITIKDHNATVNGNVSSPSASSNRVDDVVSMVDGISAELGVFEELVAEKVSVNELEAYKATVSELVAGKANIEDLEATYATIEDLVVKDAEIESLIANKAEIEDLKVVNAEIERLKVKDAEIEDAIIDNLEATKAEITLLDADLAQIKTLVSGNLTSDNISSFNVTADKVTVEDAFIKDAMIDTVNAAKINAGKINTSSVAIGSQDGGMLITGATQQFTDKNGNVRIQIGRDTSGDFTFALYGEDGQGQLINQNGITASAIADGLIVNDMVSNDAAISGDKLDISSVVTEINNDNTTTIKSNKIYLDEQNQSLEVAFNKLKTQVDTIKDVDVDGELTTITEKVQSNTAKIEANTSSINTLISEDSAIKKQVSDLEGNVVETTNSLNSKYTSLNQSLDGFKTTVANTYATKSSVNDVKNNLEGNYSTTSAMNSVINQKVDEISATISDTYATKGEMKTIDDNIRTNYSTTEQMESAISVAKDEINLGISKVYETKTNVESKISSSASSTLTNAKSYADTKKSEAISTASSDATSKANNALTSAKSYTDTAKNALNTEIGKKANSADVYTKSQTYTKSETDSAIKLSKDAIELGISEKYETKEEVTNKVTAAANSISVGGRNLLINSKTILLNGSDNGNDNCSVIENDYVKITPKNNGNVYNTSAGKTSETRMKGVTYTLSFDILTPTKIGFYWYPSENYSKSNYIPASESWQRVSFTYTQTGADTTATKLFGLQGLTAGHTYKYKHLKLEKGNKATDWTPAPEDVETSITTAETNAVTESNKYTDSAIKLSKDAIELGVSQKYETKSNVTSQVSTALTSAKSYADTKKSEAISTASSDATSKANNALTSAKSYTDTAKNALNTEIGKKANSADVYTKTQTYTKTEVDSAIKLSKDAIELGVSQKYETKEEVTNKVTTAVNNIQVGGRNLWNTNNLANGYESSGNVTSSTTNHKITNYYIELNGARYVTVQLWNPNKLNNTTNTNRIVFYDTNKTFISNAQTPKPTGSTYYVQTYTVPTNAVYFKVGMICGVSAYDESIKVKVELGNKPTDWTPAPEDIDTSIQNISSSLESFENTVNSTFKDGIVEQAEARAIEQNINILNNEKADIDKEYTSIYNNTNLSGTAKTNLNSAYTSYTSAHTSLISTINTAIADGKTTATEKASVNSTFTTYKGVLATYKQRIQEALDYISSHKVDSVQVGSRNYIVTNRVSSYAPYNSFTEKRVGYLKSTRNTSDTTNYFTLSINNYTPEKGVYTISGKLKVNGAIPTSKYFTGLASTYGSGLVRNEYDATTGKFIITQTYSGSNAWLLHVTTTSKNSAGEVVEFFDLQFEKGNKATDFHPSTEDVDTSITTAETNAITTSKNYADSQIKIAKDAIDLSVKNTYETKTEVTNKINVAKATAITESKTYADSQIKIAKDSITQRVEQTETNISTITNTTNKLNTGLNKWLIELFERGNVTGTTAITVNNLLGKTPTKTFLRDDMNGYINIGDNYLARMTTNVYLDADYSWTTNARSDDGGTLYLNGVSILTTGTTAKSVTLNFKQGWNKITWVYNENTGSDGGYFDTKLSSLSQVRVMTAYDQTNISEDLNQLNNTTTTIKGTVDNISSKHGLAYAKDIVVYGESNKYYPVYVRGGNQDVLRTIKIWRAYSEQAPSDWYNSTHKGSLMTTWQGNFGGWGGAAYREYLLEHSSEYTQLLADCNRSVHSMAYTFFLRGGGETGAIYHFASDQALTLEVYYNGSSDLVYDNTNESYKIYAYAPKTTVNTERLKNLKIARESSVTTVSNKVATIETNLNGITSRVSSTETKLNNITVGGYNLIKKKSGYKLGYLSSSAGVETPSDTINSNQDFFTTDYFPIKNGQTVYFAAYPKEGITSTLISAVYIHVYDSSKTWTKSVSNATSAKTKSIVSYTATADGYIRFCARGFTDYNHMAEYGTVPSAWSPNQDDIDSDNIGLNKWKREKYNVTLASNSTFPTMNDISGKTLQYSDEYDDSTNLISGITGDYFIAHIKTNVLVSADKTVTLTPSTTVDDTVTVYTNGVIDGRANGTEAINLRLKKGWNSISILFYEHAGGEVLTFDKKLSDHVDKMAYAVNSNSQDPTVSEIATRISTAEQKITSDAIVSTVTSSKTYTDAMTGKVNKTEIISSINQTAESVKINAGKIELTGTVVANAINSGSTTINGSKITTGSITASQIASNVLSASTIVSTINNGSTTISGSKITSGSITADKIEATALSASTIVSKINSGSTTISGSKITTGSITASQIASSVLSASTIVSTINNGSTTISGNKIRSGIIQSTNNALSFDLNGACIIVKDADGNKVGQTIRNTVSGTGVYGMSSAGDFNSYVGLSIKTSSTATTYSLGVTLLGQDGLISGYKKGVNFGLESWFWTTSNFQAASIFNATATFKSSLNYSTATGSYVYATRVYVDELRTRTSPNNSATNIKLYDSVHMNGWSVKMPVVEWDVFSRSSGDNIKFTKFSSSSESHLRLILADDTSTYFSIIANHYEKGLQTISRFKYANGTVGGSADSVRFLMYGCMNLNNWGIINAGSIYGSSIRSLSLDVESDTITVQSSSPVVLSTGDDFRDIDIPTKTQYLTASTTNTLNHHGTVTVDDEVEYVELPSDFIMCMNIHVVATPNKLCRYAITSIDEYGFVIECDEKNVTFTYTVVADKIDIMSLTERKMDITPIESAEEEGSETPVQCKIDEEPTTKDTITHKEILVEAI